MSILYSKEQDGTMNVLVSGKLPRDPQLKRGDKGDRVKFSVCYGKGKFMDCEAWADSDIGGVASCLEKGDSVTVTGTHRTWEYNDKTYATLTADMICTIGAFSPTAQDDATAVVEQPHGKWEDLSDTDGELPFE
jgi:hypothetical protein